MEILPWHHQQRTLISDQRPHARLQSGLQTELRSVPCNFITKKKWNSHQLHIKRDIS